MGVRVPGAGPPADRPPGDRIPWHDHTASYLIEPLTKSPDDVDAFAYLWRPPEEADLAIMFAMDYPDVFEKPARLDSDTNVARIRLSALAGAHVVKRLGGYEQTNFYNSRTRDNRQSGTLENQHLS
jgi:hypothetical protein